MGRFSVALVHHPVLHPNGSIISSAITNTDLHDIARSCTTFGVDTFYIVTPVVLQQELAQKILEHWTKGGGAMKNPDRKRAFLGMRVVGSIQDAMAEETKAAGAPCEAWFTTAQSGPDSVTMAQGRSLIETLPSVLMLLGTSHGLAPEVRGLCARRLEPILGRKRADGTQYNHLSVRAAAAILLHQLRA